MPINSTLNYLYILPCGTFLQTKGIAAGNLADKSSLQAVLQRRKVFAPLAVASSLSYPKYVRLVGRGNKRSILLCFNKRLTARGGEKASRRPDLLPRNTAVSWFVRVRNAAICIQAM